MTTINLNTTDCPCGSGAHYHTCCEPLHLNVRRADSPEQLMRSRYSAFYFEQFQYLINTHHPQYLGTLTVDDFGGEAQPKWLSLTVMSASNTMTTGKVTFQAWFEDAGKIDAIHECSDFIKEDNIWYYTQGVQYAPILPKRNVPCVCGSNKKFKQCCL